MRDTLKAAGTELLELAAKDDTVIITRRLDRIMSALRSVERELHTGDTDVVRTRGRLVAHFRREARYRGNISADWAKKLGDLATYIEGLPDDNELLNRVAVLIEDRGADFSDRGAEHLPLAAGSAAAFTFFVDVMESRRW